MTGHDTFHAGPGLSLVIDMPGHDMAPFVHARVRSHNTVGSALAWAIREQVASQSMPCHV